MINSEDNAFLRVQVVETVLMVMLLLLMMISRGWWVSRLLLGTACHPHSRVCPVVAAVAAWSRSLVPAAVVVLVRVHEVAVGGTVVVSTGNIWHGIAARTQSAMQVSKVSEGRWGRRGIIVVVSILSSVIVKLLIVGILAETVCIKPFPSHVTFRVPSIVIHFFQTLDITLSYVHHCLYVTVIFHTKMLTYDLILF